MKLWTLLSTVLLSGCAKDRIRAPALAQALAENPEKYVIVDVRSDREWSGNRGHIAQATHNGFPGIRKTANTIQATADQTVVLVCFTGHRSRWSMGPVRAAVPGPVIDLRGGMISWWRHDLPVVVEPGSK